MTESSPVASRPVSSCRVGSRLVPHFPWWKTERTNYPFNVPYPRGGSLRVGIEGLGSKMGNTKQSKDIVIQQITPAKMTCWVYGPRDTGGMGLYHLQMSAKAKLSLSLGSQKKTVAERKEIKHHFPEEFREAVRVQKGFDPKTDIVLPATAFKSAMADAALVSAGVTKTDMQKLITIEGEFVPVYGLPYLKITTMRSADRQRTPDMRARGYMLEWAAKLTILYIKPNLDEEMIYNVLHNAGLVIGVGDGRQGKGKESAGTFRVINERELPKELFDVKKQRKLMEQPIAADEFSRNLLDEYYRELKKKQ